MLAKRPSTTPLGYNNAEAPFLHQAKKPKFCTLKLRKLGSTVA